MTTRILAYGDSNVWGDSGEGYRYATDEQWTNILQNMLGVTYEIVQNGVCDELRVISMRKSRIVTDLRTLRWQFSRRDRLIIRSFR